MTADSNPYAPTHVDDSVGPTFESQKPVSAWVRNLKCLLGISGGYSIACAMFAIAHIAMPALLFVFLIVFSAIAAAWANLQLGPRIGWDRGGLPVVFVVFFMALTAYCSTSLVLGGTIYSWLNPVWEFHPYP